MIGAGRRHRDPERAELAADRGHVGQLPYWKASVWEVTTGVPVSGWACPTVAMLMSAVVQVVERDTPVGGSAYLLMKLLMLTNGLSVP